nr:alpha,alpha-phosphotrehalase [uncultured Blautia sp.]
MKEEWKKRTVYQIYPKSFCDSDGDGYGDIRGIISKLDYLRELGIGAVWITPMYCSPQIDNGYDISDYYEIDRRFGTKEDFLELVEEAHKRDIWIIMDIVLNHTSTEHKWFQKAFGEKEKKYRDYYIVRPGVNGKEPNNWKSFFGGSAWEKIEGEDNYYLHLFAKEQADLNWECEALRKELEDMMGYWVELGVDGFRLDVINLISKNQDFPDDSTLEDVPGKRYYINGPRLHEFLKEMNEKIFTPLNVLTVGETMDASVEDAVLFTRPQEHELDMIFSMEHMGVDYKDGDRWSVQDTDFLKLKEILSKWQYKMEETGGWNSLFWSNHDQPRVVSRFGDEGKYRIESAKMLATVLHMLKGTPYIYQGEEFGMPNPGYERIEEYEDIESLNVYKERRERGIAVEAIMKGICRQSRDNGRSPMQWDASEGNGFSIGTPWMKMGKSGSSINAEQDLKRQEGIFHYYKKLIEMRKTEELVREGKYIRLEENDPSVWCYLREGENEALLVIGNFFGAKTEFKMPETWKGSYVITGKLLANYQDTEIPDSHMKLRAYETAVFKCIKRR